MPSPAPPVGLCVIQSPVLYGNQRGDTCGYQWAVGPPREPAPAPVSSAILVGSCLCGVCAVSDCGTQPGLGVKCQLPAGTAMSLSSLRQQPLIHARSVPGPGDTNVSRTSCAQALGQGCTRNAQAWEQSAGRQEAPLRGLAPRGGWRGGRSAPRSPPPNPGWGRGPRGARLQNGPLGAGSLPA